MVIGINASFLRKIDSGTGQVTINFLRQLIKQERAKAESQRNRIILYLEEDFSLESLGLQAGEEKFWQKKVFLPLYKRDDLLRKIWWEKKLLPKKAKKDGCEIFFSLYQSATIFRNKKIKHLMLVHDVIWKIFPQYLNNSRKKLYYRWVEKAIKKADKILTISLSSQNDLETLLSVEPEKIAVAPIDCDEIFKLARPDQAGDGKILARYKIKKPGYIFYVGGFDGRKNVGFLIEAYGELWKRYQINKWQEKFVFPDLVLAGKFNSHLVPVVEDLPGKIDEVAKKFSLPKEKIKMVGFVQQKDLPAFYFQTGLFVFPSLYEGFGLSPLEAYNCACPALTNANSSLKEVTGENPALSFLMFGAGALAEKMAEILASEKLQAEMKKRGLTRAKFFSWGKFGLVVEKELEKLVLN